jgi:amino acid transporter
MAEEVINPARDMPIGIMACITFVTVLYVSGAAGGGGSSAQGPLGPAVAGRGPPATNPPLWLPPKTPPPPHPTPSPHPLRASSLLPLPARPHTPTRC